MVFALHSLKQVNPGKPPIFLTKTFKIRRQSRMGSFTQLAANEPKCFNMIGDRSDGSAAKHGFGTLLLHGVNDLHQVISHQFTKQFGDQAVQFIIQPWFNILHQGDDPSFLSLQFAGLDDAVGHGRDERLQFARVLLNHGRLGLFVKPLNSRRLFGHGACLLTGPWEFDMI